MLVKRKKKQKENKKQNTASQIAVSYKWVMPLMAWKQRGLFQEEASEWQMDSLSATLHSVCVVLKEYMTTFFFSMNVLTKTTIAGLNCFHSKNRACVCLPACLCVHACMCLQARHSKTITALCGSDGNNRQVGGIGIYLRWDLSHCQASKTFVYCLTFGYKLRL